MQGLVNSTFHLCILFHVNVNDMHILCIWFTRAGLERRIAMNRSEVETGEIFGGCAILVKID